MKKTSNETDIKYVLITHNDLDGLGPKCIAESTFKEQVAVYSIGNQAVDDTIRTILNKEKYEKAAIWITDVTPSTEEVAELLENAYQKGRVIGLWDHHTSALHLNKYQWAMVKTNYEDGKLACGTSLFYDFLLSSGMLSSSVYWQSFVEIVRLYDTWEWKNQNNDFPKQVNDLLYMLGFNKFVETVLTKAENDLDVPYEFDEKERVLLEVEQQKISQYIKRKSKKMVRMDWEGKSIGVVHAESYISELGNDLSELFYYLDAIAIINMGTKKISLRTIHEDINVAEIAMHFKGGGHPKASGFSIDRKVYELFIQNIYFLPAIMLELENKFNQKNAQTVTYFEDVEGSVYTVERISEGFKNNGKNIDNSILYSTFEEAERALKKNPHIVLMNDERYIMLKSKELNIEENHLRSQFHKIIS